MSKTDSKNSNADSQYIWMDGELVSYDKAQVSVLSHSLHYGGGAFEGIRAYQTSNGETAIFRGREHFERFCDSLRVLGYPCPYSIDELMAATKKVIQANGFKECYVRPLGYIGDTVRGLKLPAKPEVRFSIATWQWGKYLGNSAHDQGIRAKTSTYRRQEVGTALSQSKLSGPYVYSVLARREAVMSGFDEALMLDTDGFVAEGSGENIFMVKGGTIYTPPLGHILPGITRDAVIKIAEHLKIPLIERLFTRNALYIADEAFFTGTAAEVTPIVQVDHVAIGEGKPGGITRRIGEFFFGCTRGDIPEFREWLTPVG